MFNKGNCFFCLLIFFFFLNFLYFCSITSGLRQVRNGVRVLQVVLLAEIRCSPEGFLAMGKLVEMINSMSLIVDKVIEQY